MVRGPWRGLRVDEGRDWLAAGVDASVEEVVSIGSVSEKSERREMPDMKQSRARGFSIRRTTSYF